MRGSRRRALARGATRSVGRFCAQGLSPKVLYGRDEFFVEQSARPPARPMDSSRLELTDELLRMIEELQARAGSVCEARRLSRRHGEGAAGSQSEWLALGLAFGVGR